MSFYDPAEVQTAFCNGSCQASPYPPSTCRCPICRGRLHGILRNRVIDIPGFQAVTSGYEYHTQREPEIRYLPTERLQLTAQTLGHELDQPNRISDTPTNFRPEVQRTESAKRGRSIGRVGRSLTRSLKHSIKGYSETELNERIIKGLRSQFNETNVDVAIDQAFSVYQSHNPDLPRPELYELFETGLIDKALELMGKRWVIGRPKK